MPVLNDQVGRRGAVEELIDVDYCEPRIAQRGGDCVNEFGADTVQEPVAHRLGGRRRLLQLLFESYSLLRVARLKLSQRTPRSRLCSSLELLIYEARCADAPQRLRNVRRQGM